MIFVKKNSAEAKCYFLENTLHQICEEIFSSKCVLLFKILLLPTCLDVP